MGHWHVNEGAIVERPRAVDDHPLLAAVYGRHEALIRRLAIERGDRTLEVAFGTRPHPDADVGIEAFPPNAAAADGFDAATADARDLPFADGSFDVVVGRRFLHHVPAADRGRIVEEAARVLAPDGRLVVLEGTPGRFRRLTKGLAFRLGVLEEDNDEYGHLDARELRTLLDEHGFDVFASRSLGSPLVPLGALSSPWTERLAALYDRTQWVRWWTLAVGSPRK